MSFWECPKCGGIPGVTPCCTDKEKASIKEYRQALDFLCGLHECITIEGPPMAVAELIFNSVMAERRAHKEEITRWRRNLQTFRETHVPKKSPELDPRV